MLTHLKIYFHLKSTVALMIPNHNNKISLACSIFVCGNPAGLGLMKNMTLYFLLTDNILFRLIHFEGKTNQNTQRNKYFCVLSAKFPNLHIRKHFLHIKKKYFSVYNWPPKAARRELYVLTYSGFCKNLLKVKLFHTPSYSCLPTKRGRGR